MHRPSTPARLLLPIAFVLGCAIELAPPPAPTGPVVGSITPQHGYAGDLVRIEAAGLGADSDVVTVSFGASSRTPVERLVAGGLEVLVPDDATDGPVTVQVASGAGVTTDAFRFDGMGRPRYGRIALQRDLRPRVHVAVPVGDRILSVVRDPYDIALFSGDERLPLPFTGVLDAAAQDADHAYLMTVNGCNARLHRLTRDGPLGEPIDLSQDDPECQPYLSLAISGQTALVVTNEHAVAVDLATGAQAVVAAPEDAGFEGPVAAFDDDRFVVAQTFGIRLITRAPGGWILGPEVLPFDDETAFSEAVAAHPSGKVAVLESTGLVALLDVTQTPPARTAILGLASDGDIREGELAFSADGMRLAWTRQDAGRLTTYDLSGAEPVAVGGVSIEDPGAVQLGRQGQFLVGSAGGVAVVSQRTGALADSVTVRASLTAPVLRRVTTTGGERVVVEVASSLFSRLIDLDPGTLLPLGPRGRALGPGLPIERLIVGGSSLVAVRSRDRTHTDPVACRVDPALDGAPAPDCFDALNIDDVAVSSDGREAYVVHGGGDAARVSVFDLNSPTTTSVRDVPRPEARFVFESAGRLVIGGGGRLSFLDLTEMRAGRGDLTETSLPPGTGLTDVALGGGLLSLMLSSLEGSRIAQVATSTGALTVVGNFALDGLSTMVSSPSGHALLWTVSDPAGRRLVGAAIDPRGAGVREFLRIELPSGCVGGVMTASGEQFVTVDGNSDRVVLVE